MKMEIFPTGSSVLIVAAHPDDETLGMGGTIRKMSESGCLIRVLFMSDGISARDTQRESLNARRLASKKALAVLGVSDVHCLDYPDNQLDLISILELAKEVEKHIGEFCPQQVFTHFPLDLNVDHRAVSEATLVACRPKPHSPVSGVFFFEIPSSTGWYFGQVRFSPTLFVNIESTLKFKLDGLVEYGVELDDFPNARSLETIRSLAKVRGSLMGLSAAEGFEIAFLRL